MAPSAGAVQLVSTSYYDLYGEGHIVRGTKQRLSCLPDSRCANRHRASQAGLTAISAERFLLPTVRFRTVGPEESIRYLTLLEEPGATGVRAELRISSGNHHLRHRAT